jgi:hypothetical protein
MRLWGSRTRLSQREPCSQLQIPLDFQCTASMCGDAAGAAHEPGYQRNRDSGPVATAARSSCPEYLIARAISSVPRQRHLASAGLWWWRRSCRHHHGGSHETHRYPAGRPVGGRAWSEQGEQVSEKSEGSAAWQPCESGFQAGFGHRTAEPAQGRDEVAPPPMTEIHGPSLG